MEKTDIRVFQINTVFNTGSTGRIVALLKHGIESVGGECAAAYGRGKHKEYNTIKIGSIPDMYFHALMTRLTDKTAFYSTGNTLKLCRKIEEFSPDIIHLHNLHGYYVNIEVLFNFLRRYNRPVVWTLHDCWAFTGHCPYFSEVNCMQWTEHCVKCPQKGRYPASGWKDNCYENYERKRAAFQGLKNMTIVTPSKWLANLVKQSFLSEYPVEVVYNGLNTKLFRPVKSDFREKYGLEKKVILLGVANVWSPNKGLEDFIALSKELEDNYRLVLVGLNKRQLAELPDNIIGLTRTDTAEELAEIYSAADIYLNLSREETFGMTVAEAVSCGTWPIVYADTACEEVIMLSTGTIVPKDIQAVKRAIVENVSRKKNEKIENYAAVFSDEAFIGKILDIYKGMCE